MINPLTVHIDAAIVHLSSVDPIMAGAIERVGPCILEPNSDIFEALVDAIISQQISVRAADAIMARLRAATPGGLIAPDALIQLDHEALRAAGLSTPKARYIRDLTERVASGQLPLSHLPELDDEAVIAHLTAVKGIGRWTAEMILIFALGRLDVLPIDDLGFAEGVREAYQLAERPTRSDLLARGETWRPYRTIATWYMWRVRRLSMGVERPRTRIVSL